MRTRHLNDRMTFFVLKDIKNDDGDLIKNVKTDLFSCWCEVSKATVKEFKERTASAKNGELQKRRNVKNFFIRYQQEQEIDTRMLVDFKGKTYKVIDIEPDEMNFDYCMVKCEVVE